MEKIEYTDEGQFFSGHVACAGCVEALSMRVILNTLGKDTVGVVAPSCSAVILGGHPMSAAKIPVLHGTLESAAASASGVKRALKAQGRDDTTVLCLAGDGGTYDIGLQALSSAAERNEDILYVCFDNEGYMNTGGQKSSSTPRNAATGSTPFGKTTRKKNLIEILAAHRIPYIATVSPSHLNDMAAKIAKAQTIEGTKVVIVLIPCLPGWGVADNDAVATARLGVESGVFPLFEIEDGVRYTMTKSDKSDAINGYLKKQKRYRHLTEADRADLQAEVDETWSRLLAQAETTV
ncbi:MAG: pyruvate synthase subunit beta [Halieaceae bacterium]|uniref:thiamine pyrophosphate-dependent enzyme n=1 Tax=Pseudopelagicola sp. nBUS_20 TaxID=3395317 RepID=UPI003EBA0840|nr:pyruvate synthase subunit beta [Halieaceae bacterium]MCP4767115.1 pyruvate synthase subunit beta [Gammaproteobacteria bacterium]